MSIELQITLGIRVERYIHDDGSQQSVAALKRKRNFLINLFNNAIFVVVVRATLQFQHIFMFLHQSRFILRLSRKKGFF